MSAPRLSPRMLEALHDMSGDGCYRSTFHDSTVSALRKRGLILFPVENDGKWGLTDAGRKALFGGGNS